MSARLVAQVFGWVLVIVGIAGFFTGDMLIVFQVDPIHNIIHLLTGVLALVAASMNAASTFLKAFGVVYALVAIVGFAMDGNVLGIIQTNRADDYLHVALAAVFIVVGFMSPKNS